MLNISFQAVQASTSVVSVLPIVNNVLRIIMTQLQLEALQMCLEYIETNAHDRRHVRWKIKEALAAQPAQQEPQTTSQERTEFEQFWVNELGESDELTYGNHRYAIHRVNAAWEAWKAGKISANQQTIMGRKVWIDWKTQALELRELVRLGGIKIAELEAALAEQPAQPEPVARYIGEGSEGSLVQLYDDVKKGTEFYTNPQPAQQEPVATGIDAELVARLASATPEQLDIWLVAARRHEARKLQQPPAQPLTDEQIVAKALHLSGLGTSPDVIQFARAIEAAYGGVKGEMK
jgi:hypothetical protein